MELRHIRYLIAAAEEEHFGRAAERLHVTRSAVSQIVANLEEELGIELFQRHAQKITLTAAGHAMLPRLKSIMRDLNETIALGVRVGQGKQGSLKIGYGSLSTHHPIFRTAVKKFHEDIPDVVLSLVEIPTSRQLKAMQEGLIQAGFSHKGPPAQSGSAPDTSLSAPGLCSLDLDHSTLGLIVPHQHALARRGSATLQDLTNEPMVQPHNSENSLLFGRVFQLCHERGIRPQIVQEVSATVTQQDLVSVGVGIGLSVVDGQHSYPPEIVAVRIVDIDYPITFQLNWPAGPVEPALQRFIELVEAARQEHDPGVDSR